MTNTEFRTGFESSSNNILDKSTKLTNRLSTMDIESRPRGSLIYLFECFFFFERSKLPIILSQHGEEKQYNMGVYNPTHGNLTSKQPLELRYDQLNSQTS